MASTVWSEMRKRQYPHVKANVMDPGDSEPLAEESIARTVNKTRARQGVSVQASISSLEDMPVARRFGKTGAASTVLQLRNEATQRALPGRSRMKKV